MDRRQFMAVATAGLVSACGGGFAPGRSTRPTRPLAIADITVRKELKADFAGTVAALRRIGYTHLGSRLHGWGPGDPELEAREKALILKRAGMKVGAVRLNPQLPLQQEIENAHTLGARVIALSAGRIFFSADLKPRRPSLAELTDFLGELDRMGDEISKAGLVFAYHNHDFDAVPIDGKKGFDRIIEGTDPKKVAFEIDLAWAYIGGYDPLELVRRLGNRVVSLHLKDVDPKRGPKITDQLVGPGEGVMDYRTLLPRVREITDALPAVEIDAPADGLASAAKAFGFVSGIS